MPPSSQSRGSGLSWRNCSWKGPSGLGDGDFARVKGNQLADNSDWPWPDRSDHSWSTSRACGVDKALKILRYSAKLLLASPIVASGTFLEAHGRLKAFEASVGSSRKAFRLGKFVQDVNALKRIADVHSRDGLLELVATGGEGCYYFVEQFVRLLQLIDSCNFKFISSRG